MSKLLKSCDLQFVLVGSMEIPVQEVLKHEEPEDSLDEKLEMTDIDIEHMYHDMKNRCAIMLEDAERRAANKLAEAEQIAVETVQRAHSQGFAEGYANGEAKAIDDCRETCTHMVRDVQRLVECAESDRNRRIQSMSGFLTELTMEAVRTLVQRELEATSADVQVMIDELLHYVLDSSKVEIRVHPSDFVAATSMHPKWQGMKFGDWDVAILPDENIERGGCEVRSDLGRVDARMETKLEILRGQMARWIDRGVATGVESHA